MVNIRKAAHLEGLGIRFRNASVADAKFIFSLRTNENLNRYISAVSDDVQHQVDFLRRYEEKDNEALFIIEDVEGHSLGTIRIYDQKGKSFCWGSWIVSPEAPSRTAVKSALLLYIYAFEHLGFESSHFDVRQENEKVWQFHESWGAQLINEDSLDRYYSLSRSAWIDVRQRYNSLIQKGGNILVEYLNQ